MAVPRITIEALYQFLREHAYGRDHSATAGRIALGLRLPGPGRQVNGVVWELVRAALDAGFLICSGPKGYYLPATRGEVESTKADLRDRAAAMLSRVKHIEAIEARCFGEHPSLF